MNALLTAADELDRLAIWLMRIEANPNASPAMRDVADRMEWKCCQVADLLSCGGRGSQFTLRQWLASWTTPAVRS
jgi:hypothetical protein